MTVSQLGNRAGISADAVRYYERIGLLPRASRSRSGYRLYDEEALERVLFIKRAQKFGLRLGEIAELAAIREKGLCPCGSTRRFLSARLSSLDDEMTSLSRLRDEIARMLEELPENGGSGLCTGGGSGGEHDTELLQIAQRPRPRSGQSGKRRTEEAS